MSVESRVEIVRVSTALLCRFRRVSNKKRRKTKLIGAGAPGLAFETWETSALTPRPRKSPT